MVDPTHDQEWDTTIREAFIISEHSHGKLTNDPQELLKAKHAADNHKTQFTNFARSVSGDRPTDIGQVSPDEHREPDQQNTMKTVENRELE